MEEDTYLNLEKEPAEGSSVFKLFNSDAYILMYDRYTEGKYRFMQSNDLENYKEADDKVSMDFHPRHGTIIPVTGKELKSLFKTWGKPEGFTGSF